MTHPGAAPPASESGEGRGTRTRGPVVVGLGASAGGLNALKQFLGTVPQDSGMAFVVVMHLSAEHESHLADLLQPQSLLPVAVVSGDTLLEANQVYVIPPARNLTALDSHLRLAPLEPRRERAAIDHFFRTLAETHDGSSVGVILSGTGSDGASGIRYIRMHGGMTIAQDPAEAEFDGMVSSAIETGMVDWVLPVGAMMPRIQEFARTRPRVPREPDPARDRDEAADAMQAVLALVRVRTGHDFLRYKPSTVARRVARRMQPLNLEGVEQYLEVLRDHGQEAAALLDDLLINVTSFFRDPDVFRRLESEVIPALFEGKSRADAVRVWSVGCASGEEAYSLGMLLLEEADRRPNPPQVQVFATDLHEASLQRGRHGHFPEGVSAEMSAERLDRFFRAESAGYQVCKELRDTVVFAAHNLLRDPPFSRLDLIVCRNLLIYLQRDVQEDVIQVFHYALRPGGYLLLGTAETLDRSDLFGLEHKESHLYRRREAQRASLRLPAAADGIPVSRILRVQPARAPAAVAFGAQHLRMVERYAPPSLLVSQDQEVVHLSANVGRYLQHPGGEPTSNLFKLVREEFRSALRTGLDAARERRGPWRSRPVTARIEGEDRHVVLRASPARDPELEGFTLVIFDEVEEPAGEAGTATAHPPADGHLRELEAELEATRTRLQTLVEEFETGQEEMRSANEELQSSNEELRSTMEELETSREELQSVNEELQTLNQENRYKVEELSQLSSDLQNLLQATDVATLFLDRSLRILRYTPRATEIFSVRHSDRGRPLADLTHRLEYEGLIDDARRVLQTLVPVEQEVQGEGNMYYSVRMAPYRTMDDRIEGVVITLVDVTPLRRSLAALRLSEERHRLIVEAALDYAILTMDPEGRIQSWSPGAEAVFGWPAQDAVGQPVDITFTREDRDSGEPARELAQAREQGSTPDVRWHVRRDGRRVFIDGVTRAVYDAAGELRGLLKIGQDVTDRRRLAEELQELNETLERRVEERTAALERMNAALSAEMEVRRAAEAGHREVLRRLVNAEENERRRLSRELHDSLGQLLTALILGLKQLEDLPGEQERLEDLRRLADRIARELQSVALELRPPALDNLGLEPALRNHLEEWSRRSGVEADFHSRGLDGERLPPEVEATLYRVVQEGLNNVLKHAAASGVSLLVEHGRGLLTAILEDNGRGFDVEEVLASSDRARRLGLTGMRERVVLLGGELEVESTPGQGTTLFVRVPTASSPRGDS